MSPDKTVTYVPRPYLLLDEPTDRLDMEFIGSLNTALDKYTGRSSSCRTGNLTATAQE